MGSRRLDDFDAYQAERREILDVFRRRDARNVIFNGGQTHVYFASELEPDFDDPSSPVTAFDFVTGSLTADPPASTSRRPTSCMRPSSSSCSRTRRP